MSVDEQSLRLAMRQWTSGVTVFSASANGVQYGLTVSSFTSLSVTPPMLLVSIQNNSRSLQLVRLSGMFGVTVLAEDQQDISDRFAGRTGEDEDRFTGLELDYLGGQIPFIRGGLAYFECRVAQQLLMDTNTILIGEVKTLWQQNGVKLPLVYHDQEYRALIR